MTQHLQGNTPPSSHHLFSLFSPPSFLFPPPPSPSLSLSGTRTSLPSHYHSSSGTPAVDAAVNSCAHVPAHPPPHLLQFCWVGLILPLPYSRKVIRPSPLWWWTEGRGVGAEGRGEGSIWLVNFNAEADVSLCTWEISVMLWSYVRAFVVFIVRAAGGLYLTCAHVACCACGEGFRLFHCCL